jgi:hypothetical protein
MNSDVIQTLWIGPRLAAMEQMSITSFLKMGHELHLYLYQPTEGIPTGTVIREATEILPASSIFTYSREGSFAGFSNFFRYKLLLERGGWWVDTDMIALKPFDFDDAYVFSSEDTAEAPGANTGALKVPRGCAAMEFAWEYCQKCDVSQIAWGETGPRLIRAAIEANALGKYVQPPHVFCPIGFRDWRILLDPAADWRCGEETRGLHLWNEMWRRSGTPKDHPYDHRCLYERLKQQLLA